ncbi:hypothetical protein EI999_06940 [Streptococcus suis]|uniref:Uncharacterized protein n=1 Tax=Streptococcus suis TaxID=1307 RepID=A0A0Z8FIR2_STRSU|nr:hypothetical protein [Streptococcus suis]MCQ8784833.1 hypothetical protein [Streptococcus suis]MDW8719671.1 hypothetical protein [Streptococcus suis]NQH41606.1 hypothetical protein [Streptococcus suis]NQH55648.1 hypothetical protein [Streptococcus suis]NQN63022.1 hypothetical protein [Streptococcus suis]
MGLGRSFDSRLGNEIQKIAMKLARVRYNDINVPNIILINTEDENVNRKFILNLYIIKDNFQQRVFYNIKPSDFLKYFNNDNIEPGKSIEFTLPKKSPKANLELLNKYKITDINKDLNKNINKLVDLLYIEDIDNSLKTKITAFEIKSGGNLDTKNSKANVDEIKLLKDFFKFFPSNRAYFATAYNNNGKGKPSGDVFVKLKDNKLKAKVGKEFWKMVLPKSLNYKTFIKEYKQRFIESGIEDEFKKLDLSSTKTKKKQTSKKKAVSKETVKKKAIPPKN